MRQKFTGYERDDETGLDFAQARYYANTQGRFTTVDPLHSSAIPADPQSWNRYSYVGNRPTVFIDPTGLVWGYFSGNGGSWYQWYGTKEEVELNGGTVVKANVGGNNRIYETKDGGWVRLDLSCNHYDQYDTFTQAFYGQREFPTAMGDMENTLNLFGAVQGGLGLAKLGGTSLSRIFTGAGSELTTLGLSGGTNAAQSGAGLAMEGMAFELKFLQRHLPGTAQAERLVAREGAAHVFNDLSTLSRVEADLFAHGVSTGTVRGFSRVGLQFEQPIGFRIGQDGARQALNYAEMKIRANGLYHIIPRTGPSH